MATVRDLITNALRGCGAIGVIDVPTAEEVSHGLNEFNLLVESLSLDNLWDYTTSTIDGNLVKGQKTYSIGPSGYFDVTRPNELIGLSVTIGDVIYPLKQISPKEFLNSVRTDTEGTPANFVYFPDNPTGNIQIYPLPSEGYPVKITTSTLILNYSLDDTLALPVGYEGYLQYALSSVLGVAYGVDVSRLTEIANGRLQRIKRQNHNSRRLKFSGVTGHNGRYDISSDSFIGGV